MSESSKTEYRGFHSSINPMAAIFCNMVRNPVAVFISNIGNVWNRARECSLWRCCIPSFAHMLCMYIYTFANTCKHTNICKCAQKEWRAWFQHAPKAFNSFWQLTLHCLCRPGPWKATRGTLALQCPLSSQAALCTTLL